MKTIYKDNMVIFQDESTKKDIGYIAYSIKDSVLFLEHTVVHSDFQGMGYATKLVKEIISYAQNNSLKIKPICSFAISFFASHKEYDDVLTK